MLSVLHSFYKPACLVLLALLGLAVGHLLDTVLQVKLRPKITTESTRRQAVVSKPLQKPEASLNLILQNNIFDADSRSATATMTLASKEDALAAVARVELKLFGTVVAAARSSVLLEGNNELKIYHLGDKVPGDGTIEKILRNQVQIRYPDQSLTTLLLQEKALPPSTSVKPSAAGATGDIREVGKNRWLISRGMGDSVRENFAAQMRLVQMQPRTVAGKTGGFIIQRIDPQSILAKLGLQPGDVLIDVNNTRLDSPEKGLQIVQQLREARQITIAVERNNQPMSFSYEIQ
ncbi:MAG: type II secretion system protein N [Desulfurivibrionaceae bacterium]